MKVFCCLVLLDFFHRQLLFSSPHLLKYIGPYPFFFQVDFLYQILSPSFERVVFVFNCWNLFQLFPQESFQNVRWFRKVSFFRTHYTGLSDFIKGAIFFEDTYSTLSTTGFVFSRQKRKLKTGIFSRGVERAGSLLFFLTFV